MKVYGCVHFADNFIRPEKGIGVGLGNFDGLHKGHLKLIQQTKKIAQKYNLKSLVCSFNCNTKGAKTIFSGTQLKDCLNSLGIDYFANLDFLREIKHLCCEDFANLFLKGRFCATYVIIGEDFRFGTNQSGDVNTLKELGKKFGFSVITVTMSKTQKNNLSSTLIRKWLSEGKIEQANRYMFGPFSFIGTVKKGYHAGHSLLKAPTANITIPKNCVSLPFGVYLTVTAIDNQVYPSVTNIGYAPTLPKKHPVAETYILDFSEDIYGKRMKVSFLKYIRKERKFSSMDALKKQIEKDIAKCRSYFDKRNAEI